MKESRENKPSVHDVDLAYYEKLFDEWGEPGYRARQMWSGLYQNLWSNPDQFTIFPHKLRNGLEDYFSWKTLLVKSNLISRDNETWKVLFKLNDELSIEAVLMDYDRRCTLCISTQVGCSMGCIFCATGRMGFQRNLTSGEIIEQILSFTRQLELTGRKISNIVMMGMGEPFHNYQNTMDAIRRLNQQDGFNMGARRFTISTVGIIPALRRFIKEKSQVNLAISLHAADDNLRSTIVPVNRKYPIEDLISACCDYVDTTNRRISFEWILIQEVNDSIEQAEKLAKLCKAFKHNGSYLCHVNLIPLNPIEGFSKKPSTSQRAEIFRKTLSRHNIPATIRTKRGIDINAGCGQLASKN